MASFKNISDKTTVTPLTALFITANGYRPRNARRIVSCTSITAETGAPENAEMSAPDNVRIFLSSDKISEDKINILNTHGTEIILLPPSLLTECYINETDRPGMDYTGADPGTLIC